MNFALMQYHKYSLSEIENMLPWEKEVYDSSTTSKKEFRTFVDSLTTKQFEKIQQFYTTCPKLSHTFKVVNPNTGKESEYTVEGLQSFFA